MPGTFLSRVCGTGDWRVARTGRQECLPDKPSLHPKLCLRRRSIGAHAILDRHHAVLVFAERRINQALFLAHVTVDDGGVFLLYRARFPKFSQLTRYRRVLCHHRHTARFAIQSVHHMWFGIRAEMQPDATDEAGVNVAFGRMADQVSGLVDDQQVGVLVDDVEKLVQGGQ